MTKFRIAMQLREARGAKNRWYCSQAFGYEVNDDEQLMRYFVRSGGAEDFDNRFKEAMGPLNQYYCSEHFGFRITAPETLWEYYLKHCRDNCGGDDSGQENFQLA